VWVSTLALAEAIWVLSVVYKRGPAEIASAVETLLNHKDLNPDVVAAALGRFRERPTAGYSDCLLLELARKARHLPLGTFDRNLGKLDGAPRSCKTFCWSETCFTYQSARAAKASG